MAKKPTYKYRPVTRIITVEFRPLDKPSGRVEIVVTPEYAVVRHGDIIQWDIQGVTGRLPVTVGNFTAFGSAAIMRVKNGTTVLGTPKLMQDQDLSLKKGVLAYDTARVEPGVYKFDVMVDGKVVCDPDIEIRGPRI
jgi:hypothetical protein